MLILWQGGFAQRARASMANGKNARDTQEGARMKLLLHACCGPCSLEPVRLLLEEGHDITIAFANSNIQPSAEYDHRLQTLLTWANEEGIPVVDFPYNPAAWHEFAGVIQLTGGPRAERCRRCYHMRLEEAAAYAATHGFEALSTTLAVSPYQLFDICHEELVDVCDRWNITPIWQDFRPYYPEATRRSREAGMYRQNYCGCAYSKAEADAERAARKAQRARRNAEREAAEAHERAERNAKRAAYDAKQRAKKAARNAARAAAKAEAAAQAQPEHATMQHIPSEESEEA